MVVLNKIPLLVKISAFLILVIIPASVPTVFAADVILTWDRPDDSRVAGYKIFYGLAETDFKAIPKEIIYNAARTSCDIFNLTEGKTYGFAAKSMDDKGNESVFSEVIFYDVPGIPDDSSDDGKNDNPPKDDSNDDIDDKDDKNDNKNEDGNETRGGGGGGGCFILLLRQ
jgi:hypothetical protein